MGSERAELEAKVRELTERLAHADRLACIGQMSAGIAHEINNPIAYVLANVTSLFDLLDELEHAELGEAARQALTGARDMLTDCVSGVERIRRIASDLKTFARVEESAPQAIDVNRVVEAACQLADNEVRHRARLVVTLSEVPELTGDPGKLTQVVLNLLINAAQAIDGGDASHHRIEVSTHRKGARVLIRVRDTGRGIAPEHQARIFDAFFTTKHADGGSGLGLWLVQEIVRMHGGVIHVTSTQGQGSAFDVLLPIAASAAHALSIPDTLARQSITVPVRKRARVLLIDDDAALRRALKRMLSAYHDIIEGDGGEGGVEKLASGESFDVVLCDLMMPDIDGPGVYEHILEHRPELLDRLVFLSGGAFTPRATSFLDRVGLQVVEKPASREALLRVIDGVLDECASEPQSAVGASK